MHQHPRWTHISGVSQIKAILYVMEGTYEERLAQRWAYQAICNAKHAHFRLQFVYWRYKFY